MAAKDRHSFSHLARIMETDLGKQLFGEDRCSACRQREQECWVYVDDAATQINYACGSCARCRAGRGRCSKSKRVSKLESKPPTKPIPAGPHKIIAPNFVVPHMPYDILPYVAGDNDSFNGLSRVAGNDGMIPNESPHVDMVDDMTAARAAVKRGRRALGNRSAPSPTPLVPPPFPNHIRVIPPGAKLSGLDSAELTLLREKQRRLRRDKTATLNSLSNQASLQNAIAASLIFSQYEAGSAVCIDKAGWVLTCAHCFGDNEEEYNASNKKRWLLFYDGLAVQVECKVWDDKRDLALLKVIAIESDKGRQSGVIPAFPFVKLTKDVLVKKMPIFCIGQPGRDDLESTSERKTRYNFIEITEGQFCGLVPNVDLQDNSEIGTLKHNAWTYWGHSGKSSS